MRAGVPRSCSSRVGAHERRRPPQPEDVEHLARDVDPRRRSTPPARSAPSGTAARGRRARSAPSCPGAAAAAAARAGPAARCTRRSGSGRSARSNRVTALPPRSVRPSASRIASTSAAGIVGPDQRLADEHRVEPGARPSARASAGARIALSATAITSGGMRAASVARRRRGPRRTSTRSRAFTPTIRAPSASARSTSASSCASTSTARPSDQASSCRSRTQCVVRQRGEDQQDRVGADGPGLVDLHRVDREVLAQDRQPRPPRAPPAGPRPCRRSTAGR